MTLVAGFLAVRRIVHGPYAPYFLLLVEGFAVVGLTAAFASRARHNRLWRMAVRGVLASTFLSPLCLWLPFVFALGPILDRAVVLGVVIALGPLLGFVVGVVTWWRLCCNSPHLKGAVAIAGANVAAVDPDWLHSSLGDDAWVTDRVRLIVQSAAGAAAAEPWSQIEPRHLLLAISEEGRSAAAFVLKQLNVSPRDLRRAIYRQHWTCRQPSDLAVPIVPLSDSAKAVLRDAALEAVQLGHEIVGTEHLLLALARRGEETMTALGLTVERVQREVIAIVGRKPQ